MLNNGYLHDLLGSSRLIVGPVILILIFVEGIWAWRENKETYQVKESLANTGIFIGYFISKLVTFGYQIAVLGFVSHFMPFHLSMSIVNILLTFVIADFCFYWYHRISHEVKFFWAFHITHHSSQHMNLTTAYRINWFSALFTPYFFIPAVLLGCDPTIVVLSFQVNLFFQFFMHTEAVGKIPVVEGIVNTPSAHRVHHGSNEIYLDKNYGGVFMIWDRLFGTYVPETERVKYGITSGFVSNNPFVIIFHGFADWVKGRLNYKG